MIMHLPKVTGVTFFYFNRAWGTFQTFYICNRQGWFLLLHLYIVFHRGISVSIIDHDKLLVLPLHCDIDNYLLWYHSIIPCSEWSHVFHTR